MVAPSLRKFSTGSSEGRPIVCLPHAGGGASFIRPLLPHLASHADVWAFEYPGHLGRLAEPAARSLMSLADDVGAAVLDQGLSRPVIYGHSMGGKVAFETARQLEARGEPVHALVVSGCEPPERRPERHLSTASRAELIEVLVNMGGIPSLALDNNDFLNLFLAVIRDDYRLLEAYMCEPLPQLSCPVVVLSGDADATAKPCEMASWARVTTGEVRFVTCPGGHFFPVDAPALVAAQILWAAQFSRTARDRYGADSLRGHACLPSALVS